MVTSTLTDKGQTTVPLEIREAMGALPRQCLVWDASQYGAAFVRTMASDLELAGSQGRAGGLGSAGLGDGREGNSVSTPDKTPMVGLFLNVECQDLTLLALSRKKHVRSKIKIVMYRLLFALNCALLVGCSRGKDPIKLPEYSIVNEVVGGGLRQVIYMTNGVSFYFSESNIVIWPTTNSSVVVVYDSKTKALKSTMLKLPEANGELSQVVLDTNADGVPEIRKLGSGLINQVLFRGEWHSKRNKGKNVVITNEAQEIELHFNGRRYVEAVTSLGVLDP